MSDDTNKELEKLMLQNFSYPLSDDANLQEKLFKKLEFNSYKFPKRPKIENYEDLKKYRDGICGRPFALAEQQQMLANYINPDTPYMGCLLFHGLGSGKTATAITIAEKFKDQVLKYGNRIIVLTAGPILKQNWKDEIIKSTGNTYKKYVDANTYQSTQDKQRDNKEAIAQALQFYRLLSYRSFYKKVLGEKIVEVSEDKEDKIKKMYRKTDTGEYERELSADRIYSLDNSLLIVDEAHNLTGNAYGEAVRMIIRNSTNLKVLLLSATPMKNLADDIVFLINLLRPEDDQIDRDIAFSSQKNHDMEFREGGEEYLRKMVKGYVSHLRGADPLIYAKRVDHGIIPKSLVFTKIIPCKMLPFQHKTYDDAIKTIDDALDRRSEAVSNFVFPGLSDDKSSIVGYFGKDGIVTVRNQLRLNQPLINRKISDLLNSDSKNTNQKNTEQSLIYLSKDNKTFLGDFLSIDNLKHFSIKFYTALKNINKLIWGKKSPRTAFIYSNLVKVGIDLFKQVLLQNGYIEYNERPQILGNTRCYFCGTPYSQHSDKMTLKTKKKGILNIPTHEFKPASFMVITGKSSEEIQEDLPEESKRIIDDVFNNISNVDGKNIKFILGSKVINEGVSMSNVGEVHILDVYFNFGRVDQVVGRAIRRCSHYKVMSKENPYPEVHVYKYAIVLDGDVPSTEEQLYRKAEQKHSLIKKVERIMKEEAIDCALNMPGNMFIEEMNANKDCGKDGNPPCPAICDYTSCNYKCSNNKLNKEFFDEKNQMYRTLSGKEIDTTTFSLKLSRSEIDFSKKKIRELYLLNYVYTIDSLINHVKTFYAIDKKDLFNEYYVYKALDELIPITENDFNNFKDTIVDKYNRPGYLIYVNNFYIFQPFDQPKNIPMYYRTSYDKYITNNISLYDYLKHSGAFSQFNLDTNVGKATETQEGYDFDSVIEYYSGRKEFDIVGIIDKEPNKKKLKSFEELQDVFKIREKKRQETGKRRGIGIQSLTGSVCVNSQSKGYLSNLTKKLQISSDENSRSNMCDGIMEKLLDLEKYSTDKHKNKMTYIIIPSNHPKYPFPYNLEDRTKHIVENINSKIRTNLHITIDEVTENKKPLYKIVIKHIKDLDDKVDFMKSVGATKVGDKWIIKVA